MRQELTANHTNRVKDDVDTFALGDFGDFLLPVLLGVIYGVVRSSQSFAYIKLNVGTSSGDDMCSKSCVQ